MLIIYNEHDNVPAKYFDKFKTCARVGPLNEQRLTIEFFIKEHSKPFFNSHGFLNLKNLYFYHSCCEVFEIFKYKSPVAINDLFKFSSCGQRSLFIITPSPNDSYVYRMNVMWNSVRTVLSSPDTSFPISSIKTKLKVYLLNKQKLGDNENWIEHNLLNSTLCSGAFLGIMVIKTNNFLSK